MSNAQNGGLKSIYNKHFVLFRMVVRIQGNNIRSTCLFMEVALVNGIFTCIFFSTVDILLAMMVVLFVHFPMAVVSKRAGFENFD